MTSSCENLDLVLVAIFKNEALVMKEWIEHYMREGVKKFYMIDNGSTDNYMTVLQDYIDKGYIDLIKDDTKHAQQELYNKYFLNHVKKAKWCIVCDLDEFVYSRKGYTKIIDYLNTLSDEITGVIIPWKLFGSNGHTKQPDSVIASFTKRQNTDNITNIECKGIFRGNVLQILKIHDSITDGITINSQGNYTTLTFRLNVSERILSKSYLHVNHYAVQSYEWFKAVKMTRGSASGKIFDNIRNESYFRAYDHKDIDDYELAKKQYS